MANDETAFRPGLTQPGTNYSRDFEPGRMALSLAPFGVAGRNASPALHGATTPMHCTSQKIIAGMEPGEMLPLTLGPMKRNRK